MISANSDGYDENMTQGPDVKRISTVISRMNDYHENRTAIGRFITIFNRVFLLNISGGKCLEIISVENIKNEVLRCMSVL